MSEVNNLFQLVKPAQNLLLVLGDLTFTRDIDALSALLAYLKSQNKSFELLTFSEFSHEIDGKLKSRNIVIKNEIKPTEYTVTIDYGSSGVEKVVYDTDKEAGKLVFKILPSKSGFSFDKIEFKEGGGKFDATILIGITNPKTLQPFYDENEYLFKESPFFSIATYEDIFSLFMNSEIEWQPQALDTVLQNYLNDVNLIEGQPDSQAIKNVMALIDRGGSFSDAIKAKYYSHSPKYIDLVRQIFANVRISGEVIYSILEKENLIGLDLDEISGYGRIPFNLASSYKLAFLFYELQDGIRVIVESNDPKSYSASTIAGVFSGRGDVGHSVCNLNDVKLEELNKRFWPILKDLYSIEVGVVADSKNVDNSPRVLTKARRNSKNKGLKDSK